MKDILTRKTMSQSSNYIGDMFASHTLEFQEKFIDGKAIYEMEVQINRTSYGKGSGHSKKDAEQAAAKETLALMGEL